MFFYLIRIKSKNNYLFLVNVIFGFTTTNYLCKISRIFYRELVVSTNSVVLVLKDPTADRYWVNRMKMKEVRGWGIFAECVKNERLGSSQNGKDLQLVAQCYANRMGFMYVPEEKRFLAIVENDRKYQVVKVEMIERMMFIQDTNCSSTNFMKTAYRAHQLGKENGVSVEYHFFVPRGGQDVSFYPTDPANSEGGPVFTPKGRGHEKFVLQLGEEPSKSCYSERDKT